MYQVRHTPEGADDYNICDTYETLDEATAAMFNTHLRYEMMQPDASLEVNLTYVDGDLMVVVPGFGFYVIARVPVKRFVRVVEGGFIHHYGVVDPTNRLMPVTVHHSHKRALLHHPDLAGVECEVVSMSDWLAMRREIGA